MEDRIEVTEGELLEALREAADADPDWGPEDAHTTRELARALGTTHERARSYIREMVREGVVEPVQVRRPAMDGRLARVPAYRLIDEAA